MSAFPLHLLGTRQSELIEDVESFVGEDASGCFGLRARHERLITTLVFGLARFRHADGVWRYLAVPGALLYFLDNQLFIHTRRYLLDTDYRRISLALTEQLMKEEDTLTGLRRNLRQLEEAMLRQMLNIERGR
jgi:F-type H+-transporting ATPase subunit epsilon